MVQKLALSHVSSTEVSAGSALTPAIRSTSTSWVAVVVISGGDANVPVPAPRTTPLLGTSTVKSTLKVPPVTVNAVNRVPAPGSVVAPYRSLVKSWEPAETVGTPTVLCRPFESQSAKKLRSSRFPVLGARQAATNSPRVPRTLSTQLVPLTVSSYCPAFWSEVSLVDVSDFR